jgi:CRISPR-associated endonuclease Csn1
MALNPTLPYTLGLDIGMASVGAALLTEQRILGLHVRTFDKAETAKEGDPLNKTRRESRLTRRRIRRRAFRLLRLARLFKRIGLVNEARPEAFALPGISPWDLRAGGLERLLTLTFPRFFVFQQSGFMLPVFPLVEPSASHA